MFDTSYNISSPTLLYSQVEVEFEWTKKSLDSAATYKKELKGKVGQNFREEH